MALEVADSRAEDVLEAVALEKNEGENPSGRREFVLLGQPHLAQIGYGVDVSASLPDVEQKLGEVHFGEKGNHLPSQLLLLLDESRNGLPEVLGNVLRFVLGTPHKRKSSVQPTWPLPQLFCKGSAVGLFAFIAQRLPDFLLHRGRFLRYWRILRRCQRRRLLNLPVQLQLLRRLHYDVRQ